MRHEAIEAAEFRSLPLRSGGARRQVHGHHAQAAETRLEIATFAIEFGHPESFDHLVGLTLRVQGGARVSLALGIEIKGVIALRPEVVGGELAFVGLGFLEADDIGALPLQPVEQAFACG